MAELGTPSEFGTLDEAVRQIVAADGLGPEDWESRRWIARDASGVELAQGSGAIPNPTGELAAVVTVEVRFPSGRDLIVSAPPRAGAEQAAE